MALNPFSFRYACFGIFKNSINSHYNINMCKGVSKYRSRDEGGETNGTYGTEGRMVEGSLKLGWIDDVENNFRNFGFRDRKHATSHLENWRRNAGESRVNLWLCSNLRVLGTNRFKAFHISHPVHYS
jgi:hypothetical protein